ncbi:MAG: hypothetical protein QF696_10415 [Acidimicrobiales bacterium]|jgi:hypothetical protein|nr:hypothetical protein [Acidimicrobiales bacterium]
MLLWFAGTALIAMWFTFRDPAIDHRLIIVGALLPDAVDASLGKTNLMHTLAAPILLLMGLMICTIGRRQFRRQALAVPIGMFWHSVFDGAWMNTETFWWPFTGLASSGTNIPLAEREVLLIVVMEIIGLALLIWSYRLMGMSQPARRRLFLRTGRIDRDLINPRSRG